MENVIRRNRTMFKLSILALVLYVLLTIISMTSHLFIEDFEKVYSFRLIVNNIITPVITIGYIAIYILWTPDNEGNVRKRPTWQFVLLIISIFVPMVINRIITYTQINMECSEIGDFFINANRSRLLSFLSRINYYFFIILKLAMLIILFIRSEQKAKKIFIIYIISSLLSVVSTMTYPVILTIDDYTLRNMWIEYVSYINLVRNLILSLLIIIFTIIYTRSKVKEVNLPNIDCGY